MATDVAILRGIPVTRDRVISAMHDFDAEPTPTDWQANRAQKHAVAYEGRLCPPKKVLGIATGLPVAAFHGGPEANGVLEALGFRVGPKESVLDFKAFLSSGPTFDGLDIERPPERTRVIEL
jgi:hypothetical protein